MADWYYPLLDQVVSLFKDERISSGRAARLLGMTRLEFLDLLRRRGIAYLDYSLDEIAEEIEAVQRLPVKATVRTRLEYGAGQFVRTIQQSKTGTKMRNASYEEAQRDKILALRRYSRSQRDSA